MVLDSPALEICLDLFGKGCRDDLSRSGVWQHDDGWKVALNLCLDVIRSRPVPFTQISPVFNHVGIVEIVTGILATGDV